MIVLLGLTFCRQRAIIQHDDEMFYYNFHPAQHSCQKVEMTSILPDAEKFEWDMTPATFASFTEFHRMRQGLSA